MCKKKMKLTNGTRDDAQPYVHLPELATLPTARKGESAMRNGGFHNYRLGGH